MSAIVENTVGGLTVSEVHVVIGMLLGRINLEIQLARTFKKELEELRRQFTRLSALLPSDSYAHSISNAIMAGWLKMADDAAYNADVLLDEWSYNALKDQIRTQKRDKVKQFIFEPISRHDMAHKVKDIIKLMDSIFSKATDLGIKPIYVAAGEVYKGVHAREIEIRDYKLSQQRELVDLNLFNGRDEDVEKLAKLLCNPINSNSVLTVIGIVGLAGLGKTTLSKHISNLAEVDNFFNSFVIWLVASHNYDLMDLLKSMVEILFGEARNTKGMKTLIESLQTKMRGKKCLIILDDVWDTIQWVPLKSTLWEIGVSQGTTLLVTSRDKNVVEKLYTPERPIIYQLQKLSPGNSWSLFKAKFCDEIVAGSEEKDIAKRMVDKCGGVPLAIRALADLLRCKKIEEWREIEKSEIWTNEDKNGILPVLRLSYNYLPHIALKKCFAFCAIFQEDEVIKKQELIHMWMAQGFLQSNENMERMGDRYIKHLLSCSLFQEVKRDMYGRVETLKMSDLVLTVARNVSMGKCLCVCSENYVVAGEVRHLWIHRDIESRELTSKCFTKLQTCLLGTGDRVSYGVHFWLTCKHLRVLNVGRQQCASLNWKPLRSLIHLRYFAIIAYDHEDFMVSNLPNQITKLPHLQTLSIKYTSSVLKSDPPVAPFLKKISKLVNLRHIIIDNCIGIPVGLSHLKAVQTLPVINLGLNWGGRVSDMGLLTNLSGELQIHCLTLLTVEEAHSLDMGSKSNLDSLVLKWSYVGSTEGDKKNPNANEILEALQPNTNLHKLKLSTFDGTTLPRWLMGPGSPLNHIVSLEIEFCQEAVGNLKLEYFTCLRILIVRYCEKLTISFPNNRSQCCKFLEFLIISCCDKVVLELPGLLLLPKLEKIEIKNNNSASSNVLEGLGNLPCLKRLITDLQLPEDLREDSPVCKSLEHLDLDGSKYNGNTTELPNQLQHLVALQCLIIRNFKSLDAKPNWLGKLTSLGSLHLFGMPKLKHLPPQNVMQSPRFKIFEY